MSPVSAGSPFGQEDISLSVMGCLGEPKTAQVISAEASGVLPLITLVLAPLTPVWFECLGRNTRSPILCCAGNRETWKDLENQCKSAELLGILYQVLFKMDLKDRQDDNLD